MLKKKRILAINPGSTSTKIAIYDDQDLVFESNIHHDNDFLKGFTSIAEQFPFRKELIIDELKKNNIELSSIDIIIGRGGLVKPIESGIYRMNKSLHDDLVNGVMGEHASNLGGLIAEDIANYLQEVEAYIVDPVVVDEMSDVAHISGHPLFARRSIFHALNQKAVSRMYSEKVGIPYENLRIIVAHLGGGVSVGAHSQGRVIDVNNALDGSGAFSPERSGTLESGRVVDMCFSGEYTKEQIKKMISGNGGISAHLGHNNTKLAVDSAIDGDKKCALIIDAFAYNVSKEIGAMAAVLQGKVDVIILTGGIAYSEYICGKIKEYVSFIAPIEIYPGEDEMRALAINGLYLLDKKINIKEYK